MSRVFPMAGFQLTLHGRFWVIPEAQKVKGEDTFILILLLQ